MIPNPLYIQQNLLTVADERYCEPELSYARVFVRTIHASILMSAFPQQDGGNYASPDGRSWHLAYPHRSVGLVPEIEGIADQS
jgi:hypothetical protein